MKRIFLLLLLIGYSSSALSQVVTTEPQFPTSKDSLTVFFDATEGSGGLKDFNGDVYAHTGVVTSESEDDSDWQYVITSWPNNTPKIKLERINKNKYKLKIGPSVRKYYGVPENETIKKMAFVFRNSDGSKEAKAAGGNDVFVGVSKNSFNASFIQPAKSPSFTQNNTDVTISGTSSDKGDNTTLKLLVDGQSVKTVADDTLSYTYTPHNTGKVKLDLAASNGAKQDTAHHTLMVYSQATDQDRPAGLKDGITYVDDNTVRLSLFAPHKKFVYLIGDFNNWKINEQYNMNRDVVNADSTYYWIELNGLTAGKEYGFQYMVDGEIRVADPYAQKILDENNDPKISNETYPNLKSYPSGKTSRLVSVLQTDQQPYQWKHSNYDRPDKEDLVIYELLVRDFVEKHDYKTLTDTLSYLDKLGVNAIELMPVMEFDANNSWGYNPTFPLATDKYYGPPDDLKAFIDEAHSRGMAVILDMVLNHAWGPSPLVRLWNNGDYGAPTAENPYLNTQARHDFNVGFDFNHESKATQYFVDRVNKNWLTEFHFDGFRFDLSKGFTQNNTLGNPDAFAQYDASRINILKRMANKVWTYDDSAYVILEHFTDNKEEKELANYGMMLWGNLNNAYNQSTMGYPEDSDFSGISYSQRSWQNPNLVGYMESHDEERLMYKNLQYGNSGDPYNVKDLKTALNRNKMGAAFFFTIPGPKMIWQFGELGYDISIEQNGRTGKKPIKWNYYSDKQRNKLYGTFKALIRLRKSDPIFTSENTTISLDLDKSAKRIKLTNQNMHASIIGNFGVTEQDIKPNFGQSGKWYEFFSGDTLSVANTDTSMSLSPGLFKIYTTKKFEQPDGNLLGIENGDNDDGDDNELESAEEFTLHPNYPNPFNPSTTIVYDLPKKSSVQLVVYNILGKKILDKDLGKQAAGSDKEIKINASGLSSGTYIYRIKAGSEMKSRKMMLIK